MPRILQKADTYADNDLIREIRSKQGYYDLRTDKALADASGIPYQTLLRRMQKPEDLTIGELRKLNKTAPLDAEVLLRAIGCHSQTIRKLKSESA